MGTAIKGFPSNVAWISSIILRTSSILFCPVALSNVEEDKILRPSTWGAFGTKDLEGADYRACKNFGPLNRG